ncbi:hypothetical protein L484_016417 [Morus notabilis]|uniref:Epidermal patterning factor-like protein n=1 Tax=Morus notabilis TaxID=981085 RepID=W9R7V4_9ROSA|nr:protein EPIDERMAL PATTERNING FACTOR 2 [Morus notabilis]XP_024020377.1 protein EPIDERMAL PATTERNING FACTOR 2 [Morus notabilis]EXB57365.1 hypothetical protein L484_016417 [Morus notabilis]
MMKSFSSIVILSMAMFMMANSSLGLRPHQFSLQEEGGGVGDRDKSPTNYPHYKERAKSHGLGMEMYPTGSSLPDCAHACGPCFPCKRVMISFKCSVESCPIVYRCMCRGKYYHVPSN